MTEVSSSVIEYYGGISLAIQFHSGSWRHYSSCPVSFRTMETLL